MMNSEEIEKIVPETIDNQEKINDTQESNTRELNDLEKRMQAHGWNPDGELSALDWIDTGFKKKQEKIDRTYEKLERLIAKQEKSEKDAFAKAKAELEAKRIAAIEEADIDKVKEIEKQQQTMVDPSVREYADAFVERNKAWLNGTSYREMEMAAVCSAIDKDLLSQNLNPKEHFEQIEARVKEKYPDYFGIEKPVNAVEGRQQVSVKQAGKKELTYDDLDEFQKRAAKNYARDHGKTVKDYIKRLQELERR